MTTSTLRYALVSALVTLGLIVGTASSGSAATSPTLTAKKTKAAVVFGSGLKAASTEQPCQSGSAACASSKPQLSLAWSSAASTAGCRFRLDVDWGDGKAVQSVKLSGSEQAKVWTVTHNYAGNVAARRAYAIGATATVLADPQARGCSIESAGLTFTLMCTPTQLVSTAWGAKFPGGDSDISHLNDTFRPGVEKFVAAMTKAGITVSPQSTLRSPQRSYLMHYSYKVAKKQITPAQVPAYTPVAGEKAPKVCWVFRSTTGALDNTTAVRAASTLLSSMGVDPSLKTPPALRSRHNTGDAIDMRTTWTASTIKIKTADGKTVTISSGPKDGTNARLMAVGASYGVNHFAPAAVDRNHWSSDGR
ncbi:hypothetical protein [Kineosporia succinea]|uniref:Uncharacterized protein n=1 Tax=Kineosporia succinea TaxID=84632 RepID=A0ABT9PBT1_9ACTN|nr:hypothetical protein [Kineosporia succinea]MDP9830151.1 hypothetical protein [Kineosporia succinea]